MLTKPGHKVFEKYLTTQLDYGIHIGALGSLGEASCAWQ